ncbi:MAG TPA: STAS domain-containing protein [Pseudonocardiaceae bacterium]|nr:STAS domain-containing protein [Pseudonocardiaceae bacterium]
MTTADATGGLRPTSIWTDPHGSRIERSGGVLVVRLSGDFAEESGANMAQLVTQALADRPAAVVLDLSKVNFIGSSALSVLVGARHRADEARIAMSLVATRRATLLPLELTGLTRLFPVFPAVRDAVAAVRRTSAEALSA